MIFGAGRPPEVITMRILLQFPEGLKKEALKTADNYRKQGHQVFISSSPCYGACDLALEEARCTGAEKIVHFGHAPFIRKKLPIEVEYHEYHIDINIENFRKAVSKLKKEGFSIVVLATTVQHVHQLKEMKSILKEAGIIPRTSKGLKAVYEGQVLGCDAHAVASISGKANAVIFVGDGMFHPLAVDVEKPVYVIHPQSGTLRKINREIEKLRKRRKGAFLAALHSEVFGILVSTKPGQFNLKGAEKVAKELLKKGKRAHILVSGQISPSALDNFLLFDCFINTACPRLSDDVESFGKPVLNISSADELLKMMDQVK